jgi:rhodanese-related sulfurtransferase
MARLAVGVAIVAIVGAAVALVLGRSRTAAPPLDEDRISELLSDRSRPWWNGHKLPLPASQQIVYVAPEKMGSIAHPPDGCPVMPVELARGLLAGRPELPSGHPFAGRQVQLVDMRLRSLHLKEHIPDSLNVPYAKMAEALNTGVLRGTDPKTVVILYGDVFPHFEATAGFRVAGFDAYYSLEGGLTAWKAKGYPVVSNASVAEYLQAVESERVVSSQGGAPDPADVGPAALKTLLDQGIKPLIVFVGDDSTYKAGRIPGAIRVTLDRLTARFEKEPRDRLIAVYCGCCEGSAKGLSGQAVDQLRRMKFTRLLHLNGHLKGWKDQGYPLELN